MISYSHKDMKVLQKRKHDTISQFYAVQEKIKYLEMGSKLKI